MWTRSFVTRTDDGKGTKRIGLELDTRGFFLRNVRLGVARRMTSCLLVMLIEFQYLKVWNITKRYLYTGCFVYRVFCIQSVLYTECLTCIHRWFPFYLLWSASLCSRKVPPSPSHVLHLGKYACPYTHTPHTHTRTCVPTYILRIRLKKMLITPPPRQLPALISDCSVL